MDQPPIQDQPASEEPLRPYYGGWLLWIILGGFTLERGLSRPHQLSVIVGTVAIAFGSIMLIVNLIRPIRHWRKPLALIFVVLTVAAIIADMLFDLRK